MQKVKLRSGFCVDVSKTRAVMSGALATAARRLGASSRPRAARGLASDASASTPASASDASSAAAWTVGDYARTGVALGLAVATAGVCESALNDLFVWSLCKRRAMPAIETHPRLRRSLGEPLRADAWWNASVTHRGRGNLASCVFLLDGSRASTTIALKSRTFFCFGMGRPDLQTHGNHRRDSDR